MPSTFPHIRVILHRIADKSTGRGMQKVVDEADVQTDWKALKMPSI
ncbi:Uncharacterised protein [Mycobacteroides abscessus]|nr:hypothetical protein [Mycobacteroides abscessus]CPT91571.1 Uncharacterised protein [Mycobacteroides abscessus]CPW11186.1 Uncharacterised protein [Mycobacteroides abscessus]CQA09068.1 Uncharacterised protein [Mycobacteroides abscessus]